MFNKNISFSKYFTYVLHSWNPPSVIMGGGVIFSKFSQKGRVQIFTIKREGLVKQGFVLEKGWGTLSLILIPTNPFQSYLSLSELWRVFCLFTPYLSVFFVFHGKNLVLLNVINKYVTCTKSVIYEKQRHGGTL